MSARYFLGSGNASGSHENEHQSYRFIQLSVSGIEDADSQAIEMKDANRAITVTHALEELGDRLLVIRGGERGGEV